MTDHKTTTRPVRRKATTRRDYQFFLPITTRWMDNDMLGHVNNVIYYSYFDTCVTTFERELGLLEVAPSEIVPVVAETGCRYLREISFPDRVTVGLRVAHVGTSSLRYDLGVFRDDESEASAEGYFVHVYVGWDNRRPVPIPEPGRTRLAGMLAAETGDA